MGTVYMNLYFSETRGYVVEPYAGSPGTIGSIKAMRPPHTFRLPTDAGAWAREALLSVVRTARVAW
ncbi:hypothetical protein [Olsenella sp. Marseille-P4559]|uniref:hypothetical protein n=1 Tax=Olsenella sp. Marseille-P4559 TaxID=2364795 RepID=UPI0013EF497E|nr:hypothetical protein [Olsenella sp. Marseille-P4559]